MVKNSSSDGAITRKRSICVSFRLTPKEHEALLENVAASKLSLTEYILVRCVFSDALVVAQFEPGELLEPFKNVVTELKRQGNNYNQIAKVLNTYKRVLPEDELKRIIEQMLLVEERRQGILSEVESTIPDLRRDLNALKKPGM